MQRLDDVVAEIPQNIKLKSEICTYATDKVIHTNILCIDKLCRYITLYGYE